MTKKAVYQLHMYDTRFQRQLTKLREKIAASPQPTRVRIASALSWLENLRHTHQETIRRVPLTKLADWMVDMTRGVVRHRAGADRFFSVEGLIIKNASEREVPHWNQPILVQKVGGVLVIFCQEQKGQIKFLLQARFEPGNIHGIQLGPSVQATYSNLKRHHRGTKPPLASWLRHSHTTLIYKASHNEEGARFFRKSNANMLILIDPKVKLPLPNSNHYRWFTLPEIKALMLYNHVVNPYVKTILAPL